MGIDHGKGHRGLFQNDGSVLYFGYQINSTVRFYSIEIVPQNRLAGNLKKIN